MYEWVNEWIYMNVQKKEKKTKAKNKSYFYKGCRAQKAKEW